MHHSFIDKYSDRTSRLHSADPRVKIVVAALMVVAVVTTPPTSWMLLGGFAVLLMVLWRISTVPVAHLFRRMFMVVPFAALIALGGLCTHSTPSFYIGFGIMLTKTALAVITITLLTSTTRFPVLLAGLDGLGMPRIFNATLAFLYRYIFIVIDEAERLSMGKRSRQFNRSRILAWRGMAWMIATLLLRSFERSERVYRAMLARGFRGELRTVSTRTACSAADMAAGIVIGMAVVMMRLAPLLVMRPEAL